MTSGKTRLAIAHPRLGRGGSEARAMWAVEALKDSYDVSIVSAAPVDLAGPIGVLPLSRKSPTTPTDNT